jgi:hypothetical protein
MQTDPHRVTWLSSHRQALRRVHRLSEATRLAVSLRSWIANLLLLRGCARTFERAARTGRRVGSNPYRTRETSPRLRRVRLGRPTQFGPANATHSIGLRPVGRDRWSCRNWGNPPVDPRLARPWARCPFLSCWRGQRGCRMTIHHSPSRWTRIRRPDHHRHAGSKTLRGHRRNPAHPTRITLG